MPFQYCKIVNMLCRFKCSVSFSWRSHICFCSKKFVHKNSFQRNRQNRKRINSVSFFQYLFLLRRRIFVKHRRYLHRFCRLAYRKRSCLHLQLSEALQFIVCVVCRYRFVFINRHNLRAVAESKLRISRQGCISFWCFFKALVSLRPTATACINGKVNIFGKAVGHFQCLIQCRSTLEVCRKPLALKIGKLL